MSRNFGKNTFLWHDYETFGTNPQLDGVSQFAAIRTDEDLNVIGKPINITCRPTFDRLPNPEACMVTGISPLKLLSNSKTELSFFQEINKEFEKNNTCGIGYNNINFDDEVTRNGLYRNFIDPYRREWANGCSRWDLLNVLRMAVAIYPDIINVPVDPETGNKIFKLDQLSPANNIEHENAHDALADVEATIKLAKIIKEKQPEFFDTLFKQRQKKYLDSKIEMFTPYLMADSFFGGVQDFVEVVYPIYKKGNDIHCLKLTKDLSRILLESPDSLNTLLFKKKEEMLEGEERLPIHTFKINQCPVILPVKYLNKETATRLNISGDLLRSNISYVKANKNDIFNKIKDVFSISPNYGDPDPDVDTQIYSGGFFSNNDRDFRFSEIRKTNSIDLLDYLRNGMKTRVFEDKRLPEMIFRYICRNFDDALDAKAFGKWQEFCLKRINDGVYSLTFDEYFDKVNEFKEIHKDNPEKMSLLDDLTEYGNLVKAKLTS